jgi:hypothetical protein
MAVRDPEWAMWPMPNIQGSGLPNPARYTNLGGGVIRDEVTGLVWTKPPKASGDFQTAQDECKMLGEGFRLPSMIELASLAGTRSASPLFSRFLGSHVSSSTVVTEPTHAWNALLDEGSSYLFAKDSRQQIACVRDGITNAEPHYETTTFDGLAVVKDNWTGLAWEQAGAPATVTFSEAQQYCVGLGTGWRTPSMKELQTLVYRRRSGPAIDPTYFPDTPPDWFWSSTMISASIGFGVRFDVGIANTHASTETSYVRCVR